MGQCRHEVERGAVHGLMGACPWVNEDMTVCVCVWGGCPSVGSVHELMGAWVNEDRSSRGCLLIVLFRTGAVGGVGSRRDTASGGEGE